jgi:hypothetical protein
MSAAIPTTFSASARLQLYISMMDQQAARDGTLSERNSREYLERTSITRELG